MLHKVHKLFKSLNFVLCAALVGGILFALYLHFYCEMRLSVE